MTKAPNMNEERRPSAPGPVVVEASADRRAAVVGGRGDRKVRVHVQGDQPIEAFRMTEGRVQPMIDGTPGLSTRLNVTYGADGASLERALPDVEVLFAGDLDPRDLRRRAPRLRWLQSSNAGVDGLAAHLPDDVLVTNASGVHALKAGEYGITGLLMLNSGLPQMMSLKGRRRWEPVHSSSIKGKKVTILGTGSIGTAVATQARSFGLNVVGVSRGGRSRDPFDLVYPVSELRAALDAADFLVITLPGTGDTRDLIGADEMARLRRGAGLLNIGRGAVVDEAALLRALDTGHLSGAVLDVFREEPLPVDSPLWSHEGIIISAHCAIDDVGSYVRHAASLFVENLRSYLSGSPLINVVDRAAGY